MYTYGRAQHTAIIISSPCATPFAGGCGRCRREKYHVESKHGHQHWQQYVCMQHVRTCDDQRAYYSISWMFC